jgi:hypothetical protein
MMPSLRCKPSLRPACRALRRFRACDRGAATVEFVLWLPVFFGLVTLVVDSAVLAYRYSEMWDVARTAAREVSVGALPKSQTALEAYVHERLSEEYGVQLVGAHSTFWTVQIDAAPAAMSVFGLFETAIPNMSARVGSGQEPLAST